MLGVLVAAAPAGAALDLSTADRCDPIDTSRCLYPWPNDHFTVRDKSTPTGRRVHLDAASMPTNAAGKPIEPSDYNHADGFSPGATILTRVPGLDTPAAFARTGAVPITDLARAYDKHQPIVVINARTLRRQLIWACLLYTSPSPRDRS